MNKNILNILYAMYEEYGYDTLIVRIKKILEIDIPVQGDHSIEFLSDRIIFRNEKRNISFIILFNEESYKFIRDFNDYSVATCFTYDKYLFAKLYSFKTSDNKRIVISEIKDDHQIHRRIVKTIKEDTEYLHEEFEREITYSDNTYLDSNYAFSKHKGIVNANKEVRMQNCTYYFSYQSKKNILDVQNSYHILEVGASTNTPQIGFNGRVRCENEALLTAKKTPHPNIIIRGARIPGEKMLKTFFRIMITKSNKDIRIHYISSDIRAIEKNYKIIEASIEKEGEFTIRELDNIISCIRHNLTSEFKEDFRCETIINSIIAEIEKIKESILISHKKKGQKVDSLDFKLKHYNIEQLALDVYEYLAAYERLIDKEMGIPEKDLNKKKISEQFRNKI